MRIVHGFEYDVHAPLETALEQVQAQIDRLKSMGYGGVVLNVSFHDYLRSEHCWQVVEKALPMLEEAGMRVWLYDEKGYPSGGAGTVVLDAHPEYEAQGLCCLSEPCTPSKHVVIPMPKGHKEVLAAYAIRGGEVTDEAIENRIDLSDMINENGTLVWDSTIDGRVFYIVSKYVFEGAHPARNYHEVRRYPDVLNKDAMQCFLEVTYQPYFDRLSQYFGNTIEAFFTDEPSILNFYCPPLPLQIVPSKKSKGGNMKVSAFSTKDVITTAHDTDPEIPLYPYITWSRDFRETYREMFDEDPVLVAPYAFEGDSERAKQVRCRWYEVITVMYEEAFFKPLSKFCADHGVAFSGHLLMEESILGQAMAEGDFFRQLKHMQYPGIDMLSSRPADMPGGGAVLCCKTVSSISHLNGRSHVMSESSEHTQRMAGEKVDLADMIGSIAAQYAMGVDTITSYYRDQDHSLEDYQVWNNTVARIGEAIDHGIHSAPVAMYYPIHTTWAETEPSEQDFTHYLFPGDDWAPGNGWIPRSGAKPGAIEACNSFRRIACGLLAHQLDYDMIDDAGLEACKVEDGQLVTPAGERFRCLVMPYTRVLRPEMISCLSRLAKAGLKIHIHKPGSVICAFEHGDRPEEVYEFFLREPSVTGWEDLEEMFSELSVLADVKMDCSAPGLLYLRRVNGQSDRYLLVNTQAQPLEATFSLAHPAGAGAVVINPETGEKTVAADPDAIRIAFAHKQPMLVIFE